MTGPPGAAVCPGGSWGGAVAGAWSRGWLSCAAPLVGGCWAAGVAGVYARRKRRFRRVRRPEPSIFTRYWSWPTDSTTNPDRSHLLGLRPCWFCRKTRSPGESGRRGREWAFRDSVVRLMRVRRASSFAAHA